MQRKDNTMSEIDDFQEHCKWCYKPKDACICETKLSYFKNKLPEFKASMAPKAPNPKLEDMTPEDIRETKIKILRLKRKIRISSAMMHAHQQAMFEMKRQVSDLNDESIELQKMITKIEVYESPKVIKGQRVAKKKSDTELKLETLAKNPDAQKALQELLAKFTDGGDENV